MGRLGGKEPTVSILEIGCHNHSSFSFVASATLEVNKQPRASLVAQWLRICLPMQGTRV